MNSKLLYMLDRVQGFSTNVFRLETQAQTTAKAGSVITIDLPDNSIINLRSLRVFCKPSAAAGAGTSGGRLVPINELVERCEVTVGGIVLSAGSQFTNVLYAAQKALGQKLCSAITGHPEIVRAKSYVDGIGTSSAAALADTTNETYAAHAAHTHCIDHFEGFIDTCSPELFDSSLSPSLRVRLYMAPDAVLPGSAQIALSSGTEVTGVTLTAGGVSIEYPAIAAGAGFSSGAAFATNTPGYELSDLFATIECCGMANEIYDQVITAQMQQQGFLECPFTQTLSFQEVHSGTTRFNCSTASLDRIYVTWRASGYDTTGTPVAVNGYKNTAAFAPIGAAAAAVEAANIGVPSYDSGGLLGTNEEKYVSKYFNFTRPGTAGADYTNANQTMQLQLNGAYYPTFSAGYGPLVEITKNSLPRPHDFPYQMTFDQMLNNYCVQCYRFCMPGDDNRTLSGIDTRSSNMQGSLKTVNASTSNSTVNIFLCMHSVLRLGPGRSCELIT